MLCQFILQNFKSYRDETVFDMQAANIEEFADSLIPGPGQNFSPLLPVSVIYGPNGGGKSNLFEALSFLISVVTAPIEASKNIGNPFGMIFSGGAQPFRLDDQSAEQPTNFEITFRTGLAQYSYHQKRSNSGGVSLPDQGALHTPAGESALCTSGRDYHGGYAIEAGKH